jgi:flagellar biosynthetic protein FlhB
MAADDAAERTEPPTQRRLAEARKQGQIPRSADLTAAVALLAGMFLLNVLGPGMMRGMLAMTRELGDASDPHADALMIWLARSAYTAAALLLPFLSLLLLASLVVNLAQTGLLLTWKRLAPRLDALNPINGLRRLWSTEALQRLGLGVLKMAFVGAAAWWLLSAEAVALVSAAMLDTSAIVQLGGQLVFALGLRLGLLLVALALLDYLMQRWRVQRNLRMTRQEVRDELKSMDGDPLMRQRRRQLQAKLAMQRIRIDVPKADVLIVNPTEFAVALRYDEATMTAPRVVAKGKAHLAVHIRVVAERHGVPIVQRPPLARALYAAVDVGQQVPPQFYRAVAEVLAYVYQLSRKAG